LRGILTFNKNIKLIINLAWPVMVSTVLQSLLGTVDLMFISRLGTKEAAAASLGASASGVVFVMSAIVTAGTVALISRSFGENDIDEVKKTSGEVILLALIIGGIISFLSATYSNSIVKIMFNPDEVVLKLATEYLQIVFIGTIFVFVNFTMRTILHGIGDTKTPLYIFGLSNIVNLILDPLFIFTFDFGIRGAAIATLLSRIVSFVFIIIVLTKKLYNSNFKEFLLSINIKIKSTLRILKIGIWASIQQIARPITGMLMFRVTYLVGKEQATAAFGIGGQLFNYTFIFLAGLSVAISIMVGQSLGRKKLEEVDETIKQGLKLAIINMVIFLIPFIIFPKFIIKLFIEDLEVIRIGVEYLRIVYVGLIFVIFQIIYGGVFNGAGDTLPPMMASLVANIVIKLPLAYYLAVNLDMGTNGIWIAIAISVIAEAIIISAFFIRGKWKTKEI